MDENHQDKANSNQATIETKLWLPPSYTNHKAPIVSAPKKWGINWGFANRTIFDWIMLISQVLGAIAIPFVVTMIGLYATQQITLQQTQFTQQQARLNDTTNKQQHQTDIQIAQDQQRETILETYIASMRDLLLNYKLRESKPSDEVQVLARAQTLSTLNELDSKRKGLLIQFLYEANLITKNHVVVQLSGANLRYIVLSEDMRGVDLSGADLTGAEFDVLSKHIGYGDWSRNILDLSGADLSYTTLSGVYLERRSSNQATA
jgi:uncharacterized protein YjbI with pentapeptide repeats